MITGNHLIAWGHKPGPWFARALREANKLWAQGTPEETIQRRMESYAPPPEEPVVTVPMRAVNEVPYFLNIEAESPEEAANIAMVESSMRELMRVPTVRAGAVLPDACPAGIISVGAVIEAEMAIHPGFHSADICCSVGLSNLGQVDPAKIMDMAMSVTHFGMGGREQRYQQRPGEDILAAFDRNKFLSWMAVPAVSHFATQGDGNHFLYVGRLASTGDVCVVTHHGSRQPGALLYKAGLQAAINYTKVQSPETPKEASWLPFDSEDGQAYWEALQVIGAWTRASHFKIHEMIARPFNGIQDFFWNEHNYIFRRGDSFFHAKGATPGWASYERTLVPLNMAEPILITKGRDADNSLGFLPHGAGRNMSRTQFLREQSIPPKEFFRQQTAGLDARSFNGIPDLSELPAAYKDAKAVRAQIEKFGLAEIIDEVLPYGNIMAGESKFARKKPKKDRDAGAPHH